MEMTYQEAAIPSGVVRIFEWEGSNTIEDWMEILPFEYLDDMLTQGKDSEGNYAVMVRTGAGALIYVSPIDQRGRLRDFLMELSTDLPWRGKVCFESDWADSNEMTDVIKEDPFLRLLEC